jgi:uncharacterized protein YecT (DUF1311 family)
MLSRFGLVAATLGCAGVSGLGFAQVVDCSKAQTSVDLNFCAAQEYSIADQQLNKVWPSVVAHFRKVDKNLEEFGPKLPVEKTSKDAITDAQLAWITHRDADCIAAASPFKGGTAYGFMLTFCKAGKTKSRIEELLTARDVFPGDEQGRAMDEFITVQKKLPSCQTGSSTVEWKECLAEAFDVVDAKLNKVYKEVITAYRESATVNGPAVDSLIKSQRAWIQIRDNECEARSRVSLGGTGYSGFNAICVALKTIERTEELGVRFLNPIEGD